MFDGENLDETAMVVEAHSISAGAKAEFRRIAIVKLLDITFIGGNEAAQRVENTQRRLLIDSA